MGTVAWFHRLSHLPPLWEFHFPPHKRWQAKNKEPKVTTARRSVHHNQTISDHKKPRSNHSGRQNGRFQFISVGSGTLTSQSNGVIERAVGLVAGQTTTLKASLEHRIGTRVPPDAILCWIVEFAACLMNRCDIGSDGKTPLHGRKDNTPILWIRREDFVLASQASQRREVGNAIPPRSVCWHADLVARGSGCHRSKERRSRHAQRTSGESRSRREMGRGQDAWNTSRPTVPGWQRQCIRYSSRNGEARGDGASSPLENC